MGSQFGGGVASINRILLAVQIHETCVVYLLGYPGMGKRTIGSHLAPLTED